MAHAHPQFPQPRRLNSRSVYRRRSSGMYNQRPVGSRRHLIYANKAAECAGARREGHSGTGKVARDALVSPWPHQFLLTSLHDAPSSPGFFCRRERKSSLIYHIIMVALCNSADYYIFILSFVLSSSSSFFFPHLISAAADWMSAILPHMVWP